MLNNKDKELPMSATLLTSPNYYYERKFVCTELTIREIELIIKTHPALFSEIYHERFVNSIYLDSLNMTNYYDSTNGSKNRLKVRIRWYDNLLGHIEKPILELKNKHDLLVTKKLFPIKKFSVDNNLELSTVTNIFKELNIPDILKEYLLSLQFALLVRYKRKYFLSADKNFRITTDSEIEYYQIKTNFNNFLNKINENTTMVLELKYDRDKEDFAGKITNFLLFRMWKNSKYVNGVTKLLW